LIEIFSELFVKVEFPPMDFFDNYFRTISASLLKVDNSDLELCVNAIEKCVKDCGKIIIAGNGGSAAIASHVSVDFTKAAGIRSINFNEADLLTCFSNDFGYERWLSKSLEFYADPKDLVILISSSGNSANIVNAVNQCKKMELSLITLTGFSAENPVRTGGNINLWVDSEDYNCVEMTHHIWLLALVDKLISKKAV
jgi:D-sedoheptulose 7-phosphate isomerase